MFPLSGPYRGLGQHPTSSSTEKIKILSQNGVCLSCISCVFGSALVIESLKYYESEKKVQS